MSEAAAIAEAVAGLTIPKAFLATAVARATQPALRWKEGDRWAEWTWQDYAGQVALAAAGFRQLGVGRGDRVVLMLRNLPEFYVADTALTFLGACPVSIYNSSSPEQIQYLASHCEAKLAVVDDLGFLERFLKVRGELPDLGRLVLVRDPDGLAPSDVLAWPDLLATAPADLEDLVGVARPDDLCTIIYTSGTTGPPKGVMLDHANVAWTGESLIRAIKPEPGWRQVSYLPMAHIAERLTGHYNHLRLGAVVSCCPDPRAIAGYLGEVRPNLIFGVPRVWEKIHAGVMAFVAHETDLERKATMLAALDVGRRVAQARIDGKELPSELAAAYEQAEAGLLSLARALVGLDDCKLAITGAAPISDEVLWFFRGIGVPLAEIYGMSESTGPISFDPYEVRIGTVGRALPGVEVRLADDGEVCFRGGNVFRGYLKDPTKTAETIDGEGWVHTGDLGQLDVDGYLRIVDRKKELIITAGGKNVSPANIESALKSAPLVGQACVIGDRRKFLSALIVLDPEVTPAWARGEGIEFASLADLASNPVVRAEIERSIREANQHFSEAEAVRKFTILPDEWMPDSDELTPTMKLKRRGIHAKYEAEIEAMYV